MSLIFDDRVIPDSQCDFDREQARVIYACNLHWPKWPKWFQKIVFDIVGDTTKEEY